MWLVNLAGRIQKCKGTFTANTHLKDCKTAFIKHVFPRFLRPGRYFTRPIFSCWIYKNATNYQWLRILINTIHKQCKQRLCLAFTSNNNFIVCTIYIYPSNLLDKSSICCAQFKMNLRSKCFPTSLICNLPCSKFINIILRQRKIQIKLVWNQYRKGIEKRYLKRYCIVLYCMTWNSS